MKWFTSLDTKTKVLIGIVAAAILAVIIYFVVQAAKKKKEQIPSTVTNSPLANAVTNWNMSTKPNNATAASNLGTGYTSLPDGDFPLKKGSKNKLVHLLQHYLNKVKGENLTVDGNWGTLTETAVLKHTGKNTLTLADVKTIVNNVPTAQIADFAAYSELIQTKILQA